MTLHSTIRPILQRLLDWARERRDYYGMLCDTYRLQLNTERKFQSLMRQRKERGSQ
jgi:hypothetical protein